MRRSRQGWIHASPLRVVGVAGLALLATSGVVSAHGVGGTRFDAPLPLGFLFVGAGSTVALTAGWLAVSDGAATADGPRRVATVPASFVRAVRVTGRTGFLAAFLLALLVGLVGPQVAAENLATVFVWPVWLKGVGLLAALVGSPWRVLSPWRTAYEGLRALEGDDVALLGRYPGWLGEWPALVGFVLWIGVAENLTAAPRSPRTTTLLVAGYAAVMVAGAVAYGDEWLERADALAVLYGLFGRVAPFRLDVAESGRGTVSLRAPWRDCSAPVAGIATVAVVVAAVYTVSFDGFSATPEYQALLAAWRALPGLGASPGVGLYVTGLLLFWAVFAAVVAAAERLGGRDAVGAALRAFAPTVLPIAVAYEVAHNYPYVARNLGQLPVALGAAVGDAPAAIDPLAWLPLPAFWASQVALVVLGHLVAVVAAHRVAASRYSDGIHAVRAHVPLTALMVAYTVLSLWIVSRPVVG